MRSRRLTTPAANSSCGRAEQRPRQHFAGQPVTAPGFGSLLDAELAAQHRARGVVAGHAVHAAARRCGRRAQVHLGNRRGPRVEPQCRTGQRAEQRCCRRRRCRRRRSWRCGRPAARRARCAPRPRRRGSPARSARRPAVTVSACRPSNPTARARRSTAAVGPRVDAAGVGEVRQGGEHHRPFGVPARGDLALGVRHLRAGAAHVQRRRARQSRRPATGSHPDSTKSTFATPGPKR